MVLKAKLQDEILRKLTENSTKYDSYKGGQGII